MIKIASLAATMLLCCLTIVPAASTENPKIGAILPLTGDSTFWGTNPRRGTELAMKELPGGAPFQVLYEDDACDAAKAVTAFYKLIEISHVKIILGPACSSPSLAVAPLAEKYKVLLIAFGEADSLPTGPHVFRIWIPNGRQGRKIAKYIFSQAQIKKVGLLNVKNAYGEDLARVFTEEYTRLGGTVAAHEEFVGNSRDVRTQLLRIKSKEPQGLFFASYTPDGIAIVKGADTLRLRVPLFGCSTVNSADFVRGVGELGEGLVFFDVLDTTGVDLRNKWKTEFKEEWPGVQSGAPFFYDMTKMLAGAIKEVGDDPEAVASYLSSKKDFIGATGNFRFDGEHNLVADHVPFVLKDGEIKPLKELK